MYYRYQLGMELQQVYLLNSNNQLGKLKIQSLLFLLCYRHLLQYKEIRLLSYQLIHNKDPVYTDYNLLLILLLNLY